MFVLTMTKSHSLTKMMQMTCKFTTSLSYKPFSSSASLLSFKPSNRFSSSSINYTFPSFSVSAKGGTCKLTWDDVLHISQSKHVTEEEEEDPCSYLQGFFHKVQLCNRGSDKQSEFLPFIIEGNVVGFIHNRFIDHLRGFSDAFIFSNDDGPFGDCISFHPSLKTADERTSAVGYVIKHLGEEHIPGTIFDIVERRAALSPRIGCFNRTGFIDHLRGFSDVFIFSKDGGPFGDCISFHPSLKTADERTSAVGYVIEHLGEEHIPGIRNELYPVKSSFDKPVFFSLERAAAPYFGIKAYGIHMNGYVELHGEKHLWIGKRSHSKSTYPGMLDHLVAGGLPHGIDCQENVVKECEEEAGIPRSISIKAKPVGAVSYMDIDGYRYKRDVLFCYDLILPESFVPKNEDGEVESFKLIPVKQVAEVIRKTQFFKPNCAIVIIDFLFRHGYISPENHGYLDLMRSLRKGDCS